MTMYDNSIPTFPISTPIKNPMLDMMGPVLVEAFGTTFASKEDVERIEKKLDEVLTAIRLATAAAENIKAKGGMLAKILGMD